MRDAEVYGWPPSNDLEFRFSPHEDLTTNTKRLLVGQIQHSIHYLQSSMDAERAVHSCRIASKRIDALLALISGLPAVAPLRKQTSALRKMLSKYRDTTVVRDHIAELPASKTRLESLVHLDARRADFYGEFNAKVLPITLNHLQEMYKNAKHIDVPNEFSFLETGLSDSYASARAGLGKHPSSKQKLAKQLHQWRELTKRHGYHLDLLMPCAPVYLEARALAVHRIGHCLGEYHDLELMRREVNKPKVRRIVRAQQRVLLDDALALKRWVMEPSPVLLIKEIKKRWLNWHRPGKKTKEAKIS